MPRQRTVGILTAALLIICGAFSQSRKATSRQMLIERYSKAVCLPVTLDLTLGPPTRVCKDQLTLSDGSQIEVSGVQMPVPGGKVYVTNMSTGRTVTAANPGYYVYPSDVRISAGEDLLYVKASGLAVGLFRATPRTDLFEYDLRREKLLAEWSVPEGALPAECPATTTISKH